LPPIFCFSDGGRKEGPHIVLFSFSGRHPERRGQREVRKGDGDLEKGSFEKYLH
jgi:hypothetical protein